MNSDHPGRKLVQRLVFACVLEKVEVTDFFNWPLEKQVSFAEKSQIRLTVDDLAAAFEFMAAVKFGQAEALRGYRERHGRA